MRALALVLLLVAWVSPSAAEDLLANGDFARGGALPTGWIIEPVAAPKGAMALRPAPAGATGRMLVLTPNAQNTPSDKPYGIGQMIPGDALRGQQLVFSATLSGTGGASAVAGLAVLTNAGVIASAQLRNDGPTATRLERLAVPNEGGIIGLIVFLVAEGTAGTASFANVSVRPAAAAPTPPPPANRGNRGALDQRYAAGPDLAATVNLDTSRVIRTLPRSLFGTNVEVIQDGQGLVDVPNRRLNPRIVALARDLELGPIRFPGGVWSDAYDWRKGVGPLDRRPTQESVPGAGWTYRHVFGTDEALELARAVGSTLLITVNVGSGTPELAADWVRYVNGEGGRSPRGPRVELWEIGNEIYMADDASGGHMSPEAYAQKVTAFSAAMKAVDPSIRIAAIGLRNFGKYRFNKYHDWNEILLQRAAPAMDMLAIHNAYSPVVGDAPELEPADIYAGLWAFPRLVARNLADTWRDVERFAPAHAGRITLGITEWGPLYGVSLKSPWVHHVRTIGSAIYVAAALKVFAEAPHLELANFFKLNEPSFMGWIGKRGREWVTTAPYSAFQMVSRDMEKGLIAAQVAAPTYDSPSVGLVDAQTGVPLLDALATRSADGRAVTALLINKSLNSAMVTRVALGGAAGAGRLTVQTLTGATVDANTGTEILRMPGLTWARQRAAGPDGRIDRGGPNEITHDRAERSMVPAVNEVRVPAHSLVLLRFEDVARP